MENEVGWLSVVTRDDLDTVQSSVSSFSVGGNITGKVVILLGLSQHLPAYINCSDVPVNKPTTATIKMTSKQDQPLERSKNAIAVKQCRERQKEREKERQNMIGHLKVDNQRMKNNINAMEAQLSSLQNIFQAHNVASGGAFSQDSQMKEFFK